SYSLAASSGIQINQNGIIASLSSNKTHRDVRSEVDERSSPSQQKLPLYSSMLTSVVRLVQYSVFIHLVSDEVHCPNRRRRNEFSLAGSFSTSFASAAMLSRKFSE